MSSYTRMTRDVNRSFFFLLCWILISVLHSQQLARAVVHAFHDCVQSRKRTRSRGNRQRTHSGHLHWAENGNPTASSSCQGGICVGMTNGPHQGGNASYPLAWNGTAGTRLKSYMSVPDNPPGLHTEDDFSQITYYIWADIFFGDESLGRMNQLVPQLILGSALDGSTGPPNFDPEWNSIHTSWSFGAHYFFEVWNPTTNSTDAHASYGEFFPAVPGEILLTTFELSLPQGVSSSSPAWKLTMSVVGDPSRTSVLTVSEPYMGLGKDWETPSTSWLEPNFRNLCINACWELYGASEAQKLPASGAKYRMEIEQPIPKTQIPLDTQNKQTEMETKLRGGRSDDRIVNEGYYAFTTWEQDEGNGVCPSCKVSEVHTERQQDILIEIDVSGSCDAEIQIDAAYTAPD